MGGHGPVAVGVFEKKELHMRNLIATTSLALVACAGLASAQNLTLSTTRVATGLARPLYVTSPVGDNSRLFVLEQRTGGTAPATGRIRIVNLPSNTLNATAYLSIGNLSAGSEQGLLGLAFHPDFLNNGYFYVNFTRTLQAGVSAGSTQIVRYRANAPFATSTTADPASATVLLTIPQPDANHNGGWISFGPDGFLYIATGDGGCFNDTTCGGTAPSVFPHSAGGNAQDRTANLLGKMLRLDVDGPDNIPGNADDDAFPADANRNYAIPETNPYVATAEDDEIYMYGLRNHWRNSFDRATGDLWIADVGQDAREEVNLVRAGQGSGFNFGWRCMEGTRCTGLSGCTCASSGLIMPILEYGHTAGTAIGPTTMLGCSITGGVVYRGSEIPCLDGYYFFTDVCTANIHTFRAGPNGEVIDLVSRGQMNPAGQSITQVVSFGEDNAGNVYIVDQSGGEVYRVISTGFTGPDCNNNSRPDACDIRLGVAADTNNNGVPDSCEVIPCDDIDFNNNGVFPEDQDVVDFFEILAGGTPTTCDPVQGCNDIDFNNNGVFPEDQDVVDFFDVLAGGECP
jgi:glucose/arabinose dehydrogenase